MKDVRISGLSDVGMTREKNEDSLWAALYKDMAVLVVADGMGGYLGGQMASGIVVQTVKNLFDLNRNRLSIPELIEDSLILANEKIKELSHSQYEGLTVGSTCVLVVVAPSDGASDRKLRGPLRVQYTHLGDSRLYLIRGSVIRQISVDHTMLQKLVESRALSPTDAANYAHKNVIYKSLDGKENFGLEPAGSFDLERGGVLLLCSDGLSNFVGPEDMVRVLQGTPNLDQAANYMVHLANSRGGDDNISVLLLEHGEFERQKSVQLDKLPRIKRKNKTRRKRLLMAVLLAVLLISTAAMVLLLRKDQLIGSKAKPKGKTAKTTTSVPKAASSSLRPPDVPPKK